MSKEKIEMTEKQFEELCKAVYPHLKAIQEALKGNGEEMSASISVGSDGYLNFHPYNSDWELSKFKDSQATMKYEHRTILKMEIQFYTISEDMARAANDANSMSDYKQGSATEEYRKRVESVYAVVEKIKQKRPNLAEKAERMAGRYSKKLAEYYNSYYRNEASCPSVLISGAGNFPVKKKNKQNSRRDSLMQEWNSLESYAKKITNLLTMNQPILSGDAQAIEMLEEKLESLTELQDRMKAVNAYWRKHKTVEGCPELSVSQQEELKKAMSESWHLSDAPFAGYQLSNNNAKIKNTKARLERLKKVKEAGTKETENDFFKVVENTELMRLQLFFDGKPDEETRDIVKKHGFRWSPKNGCWQRQLTANGKYALKEVITELQKTSASGV